MVRRKKNGLPKIAIVALAVVFIGGGLILALPSIGLQDLFAEPSKDSSTDFFTLPPSPQLGLLKIPSSTIDCFTKFTLTTRNVGGNVIAVRESSADTSELFVVTSLFTQGGTSDLAKIGSYTLQPKMRCDNKSTDGGLIGYEIPHGAKFIVGISIKDKDGNQITVGNFNTPTFSHGDLNDNYERFFPAVTIQASTIDNKAKQENFRYNSAVTFIMSGEITLQATGFPVFYKYFTGLNNIVQTQALVTVDKVPTTVTCPSGQSLVNGQCVSDPTAVQNETIEITEIKRKIDGADVLGNWNNKVNIGGSDAEATISVRALLRDFRVADSGEISPQVRVEDCSSPFTPQTPNVFMSQVSGSGSLANFFTQDIVLPVGVPDGTLCVKVTSQDRSQSASRAFQVEDEVTQPTFCPTGHTGTPPNCVLVEDPNVQECPAGQSGTFPNCVDNTTTTCADSGQIGTFPNCSDPETPPLDDDMMEVDQTTGDVVAKIKYLEKYVASSSDTNRSCTNEGEVPEGGIALPTFQLIGQGDICKDQQFSEVELTPTLDFGSSETLATIVIDKSSVRLDHKLFMSINNPFPDNPTFACSNAEGAKPNCSVSNYAPANDPNVSLTVNEITAILNPVDAQTSGEYQLSKIVLTSGNLEQKLRSAGVLPKQDDIYSYMLQVSGIFSATVNGVSTTVIVPTMVITQDFKFNELESGCNLEVSFIDENGQCMPTPRECTPPQELNPATNSCETPPDEGCPAGTHLEGTECVINPSPKQCEPIPTCGDGETHDVTGQQDACGFEILQCVLIEDVDGGDDIDGKPVLLPPTSTGGCLSQYFLNAFGNCQLIGSGSNNNNEDPDGDADNEGQSFAQFLAGLFSGDSDADTPSFTLSGATGQAVMVVVLLAIIIIIIAIIVRRRRGQGIPFR